MADLSAFVNQHWYRQGLSWLSLLLWPLSLLFMLLAKLSKHRQEKIAAKQSHQKPVIVVGNISVGGTGKTPLLVAIGAYLQSQGIAVAVVSRGYGGQAAYPYALKPESSAAESGDEPLLIYQRLGCLKISPENPLVQSKVLI